MILLRGKVGHCRLIRPSLGKPSEGLFLALAKSLQHPNFVANAIPSISMHPPCARVRTAGVYLAVIAAALLCSDGADALASIVPLHPLNESKL